MTTTDCRGFNGTALSAAFLESAAANKAYAVSELGELLTVALITDKQRTECHVRSRRSSGLSGLPMNILSPLLECTAARLTGMITLEGNEIVVAARRRPHAAPPGLSVPARMVGLKGYFLVVSASELVVFNTSIHIKGGAPNIYRSFRSARLLPRACLLTALQTSPRRHENTWTRCGRD